VFQLLEAARRLDDPAVTVHFAATVQEEVGLRGAQAIGVELAPDLGLAFVTRSPTIFRASAAASRSRSLDKGLRSR
jgi:putative aminopeptidase FrvX